MINLAWLTLGAIQAVFLRSSSRTATPRIASLVARISQGHPFSPRVGLSSRIGVPVALGMVRPMIILPDHFAENEPDDRLEAALTHEWAHIRNGDLCWLALLRLLNIVLYAQPLFWWLRRTIRVNQEVLADAAAATVYGDNRLAYAATLVGWARSWRRPHHGALASAALALWERPSMLHERVRLLLDLKYRVEAAAPRCWSMAAASAVLFASVVLSMVTLRPSAATAQERTAQHAAANAATAASGRATVPGDQFVYAGRVLDPDGKPSSGARIRLSYGSYRGPSPPPVRATSDGAGKFQFTVTKGDFTDTDDREPWTLAEVVATADGFGPGWARGSTLPGSESKVDPLNLSIRLVRDDMPISGRIVDLQGHPVANATIRLKNIMEPEGGDLSAWLVGARTGVERRSSRAGCGRLTQGCHARSRPTIKDDS